MKKFNGISHNEEFKILYEIENLQNTDFVEHNTVDRIPHGLGFTSDVLLNDKMTLMDFSEMTGLEEYNKTERK